MNGQTTYLDTSVIVKRYVEEAGTDKVRELYVKVYAGDVKLAFSVWNVGEVLGVLDRARQLDRISEKDYVKARKAFLSETRRLTRLGLLILIPVKSIILIHSWRILEKRHIYQADALQIASAKHAHATQFLAADKKLHEVASSEGLNSICLG
ncbi:MAG: type II toxin-antitoxin system VapC family toxin [Candidatus Bathyarchaeota archaeon]